MKLTIIMFMCEKHVRARFIRFYFLNPLQIYTFCIAWWKFF